MKYTLRCKHCGVAFTDRDKYLVISLLRAHKLFEHGEEKTGEGKELLIF